ncbi:hypothetical protein D081_1846 [Anaerovibrio sp. JC8]|nr:hypothetical protein D081_1846 [Anaerovibrio sp. JC8]
MVIIQYSGKNNPCFKAKEKGATGNGSFFEGWNMKKWVV